MVDERKVQAALEEEVAHVQERPDLWAQVRSEAQRHTPRESLWQRLRLGPTLEVAMLVVLLAVVVGLVSVWKPSQDEGGLPAGVSEPVDEQPAGSEPPDGEVPPGVESLSGIRRQVPFPVFVLRDVPAGMAAEVGLRGDPSRWLVDITYRSEDGQTWLHVLNGPDGCCLDADPRKTGQTSTIRGGITAHFIDNQPEFGGPILWWVEAGTYVALMGPELTHEDLLRIAQSMSPNAELPLVPPSVVLRIPGVGPADTIRQFADLVTAGEYEQAATLLAPSLRGVYEYQDYAPMRNTPVMAVVEIQVLPLGPIGPSGVVPMDVTPLTPRSFAVDVRYKVVGLIDSDFTDGEIYRHKITVVKETLDGPWLISEISSR